MYCTRKITNSIHWVGGNDRRLALFENLFPIPRGVSYNSYLIEDEKIALIDTVDASITQQYLENVLFLLNGRTLDYLIINHMEPDHCANIEELLLRFPDLKIVGNAQTFSFIKMNIIIIKISMNLSPLEIILFVSILLQWFIGQKLW